MSMIQIDFKQGSEEWLDNRLRAFNASEAPVMMGCHPNMTRDELLEAKATCNPKTFSEFVQKRIFAKGHKTEADARPILEAVLGEELYPISGKNGLYQASFDGLTLMQDTGFEHKQLNAELTYQVASGKPPAYIFWQLEHQLLVCPDLEKIILVVSDGTADNWTQMDYTAVPGRREQLITGWEQFGKDVAIFKAPIKTVEPVGTRPDSLPTLFVEVAGQLVTKSNLAEFRAGAEMMISSIKTDLQTDEDFADADQAIKYLADAESRIDTAIEQAMSRTGPLEELVRTLKDVQQNLLRTTRLGLNKQVEAQKVNRRNQIVADAESAFAKFLASVNAEFTPVSIGTVRPDFYLAIKGKRSFLAMISACNDLIAQSKIQVNEISAKVRSNLCQLAKHADHDFLFSNKQVLAFMEPDHLQLTVQNKISEYRQQQEATEAARVQGHKNAIVGIEAAGEFLESVPYSALVSARKRIDSIDTGKLQEFAIKGEQVKAAALENLDARIREIDEAAKQMNAAADRARIEQPQQRTETKPDVEPVIHTTEKPAANLKAVPKARPSDREIVDALAAHFRVHDSVVLGWLLEFNHEIAGHNLASGF